MTVCRQSGLWLSSILMAGEVCRRFLWTLVRIESEHAKTRKMPSLGDSDTAKTSDHVDEIMVAVPALQGRARDEAHPWTPTRSWGQIRERVNVARVLSSQRESGAMAKALDGAMGLRTNSSRSGTPPRTARPGSDREPPPLHGLRSTLSAASDGRRQPEPEPQPGLDAASREPPSLPTRTASGRVKQRAQRWESEARP